MKNIELNLIKELINNSDNLLKISKKSHGCYRLQPNIPGNKINSGELKNILYKSNINIEKIISPNEFGSCSGKYDTYYISKNGIKTNFVLGNGENKGQKFERLTAESIKINKDGTWLLPDILEESIKHMNISKNEIEKIEWIGKSNSKRCISLEPRNIGNLIADFKIYLKNGFCEYISLKNKNGDTFGNHGYNDGFKEKIINNKIYYESNDSIYDEFIIKALGASKNTIANGISDFQNKSPTKDIENYMNVKLDFNKELLKKYLVGAYGYGYWYVREKSNKEYKIINLKNKNNLDNLINDIVSVVARYPRYSENKKICSKQFQATIITDQEKFVVELRHSHRGIKPNELKLKSFGKITTK